MRKGVRSEGQRAEAVIEEWKKDGGRAGKASSSTVPGHEGLTHPEPSAHPAFDTASHGGLCPLPSAHSPPYLPMSFHSSLQGCLLAQKATTFMKSHFHAWITLLILWF